MPALLTVLMMTTQTPSYYPALTTSPVQAFTIGDILRHAAERTPDAPALLEAGMDGTLGRAWTYQELLEQAETLAHALTSRYQPGERICVWAPNVPEWVILEFASALAGLTLVTANPAYQPRELRFVLEQSRSVGLFMVGEYRGNPMAKIAAEVADGLPALREVIDLADAAALYAQAGARKPLPTVLATDPVQIQYTSGTTGFPKGAVLSHLGLVNNARFCFECAQVRHGESVLLFMPLFHTTGCAILTLGSVQFGCRVILAKLFDPAKMNALIAAQQVNMFVAVPTMLIGMLEAQAAAPCDLTSIRMIVSGGSMVPPELVRQVTDVFGCGFQIVYGQTESSPVLTQIRSDDSFEDACHTAGRPIAQTEISIREPNSNAVVPMGGVGEICARGYCLMIGYNDNPEATAAAIDAEGWLRTGDLGTLDDRGYVRVTGRVKDMIIRGGENLFPAEIENILLEHADVAEVAVIGVPDTRFGEAVACFVRPTTGAKVHVPNLVAHCRAHMSAQKTPAHWIEVAEWPLTGSGKIQKFVLRDRYVAGEFTVMSR